MTTNQTCDSSNDSVSHAIMYAELGLNVFPLHSIASVSDKTCTCQKKQKNSDGCYSSPGKHPRTRKGFYDATTDIAQITKWWNEWPDANIGIRTGIVSKIFVLDIDYRYSGDDSLYDLQKKYGKLPDTVESITGGGGRHIYFAHPGGVVKSDSQILGPGIDIKGDRGYVVAPPSLHLSGEKYFWEDSSYPNSLDCFASAPEWLLEKMIDKQLLNLNENAIKQDAYVPLEPTQDKLYLLSQVLDRLEGVKKSGGKKNQYKAYCPSHNDTKRSLSIGIGRKCIVFNCFAKKGCDENTISAAIKVPVADLFFSSKHVIGDKADATTAFIKNWWLQWKEQEVGTSQLYDCATTCSPKIDLGTGGVKSKKTKLGRMVSDLTGVDFLIDIDENTNTKVRVTFIRELNNAKRWKLKKWKSAKKTA